MGFWTRVSGTVVYDRRGSSFKWMEDALRDAGLDPERPCVSPDAVATFERFFFNADPGDASVPLYVVDDRREPAGPPLVHLGLKASACSFPVDAHFVLSEPFGACDYNHGISRAAAERCGFDKPNLRMASVYACAEEQTSPEDFLPWLEALSRCLHIEAASLSVECDGVPAVFTIPQFCGVVRHGAPEKP